MASFKDALEAALKSKLQNMPQMLIADDLKDEMLLRRSDFDGQHEPRRLNEQETAGYIIGVDSVYTLLLKLLEHPPAEWEKVSTYD